MNFKPILRAQEKKIKDDNNSTKIEELNGWAGHSLNYDDKERNTALFTYLHRLYKSTLVIKPRDIESRKVTKYYFQINSPLSSIYDSASPIQRTSRTGRA